MQIIELSDISFSYSAVNGSKGFSINGLNFTAEKGEFISILGPNGSGKSTLLKIIANIFTISSGKAYLFSRNYSQYKRSEFAKLLAFVPQNSGTNFPFSIYEIVMMGRSPYLNFMGIEKSEDQKLVMDTLDLLEISHLKNKGINEVSGGEAQRALIARALVQQPQILLLDEPSTHLDIKHQLAIYNLLNKLNSGKGLTIITISHDINFSNQYSSRVILMKEGNIKFDSPPEQVLNETNIKDIFGVSSKIIREENGSYISFVK